MDWSRIITGGVGWAAGVFQTIERAGEPLPPGPLLVVANHPNSLLDPLVIFKVAGRPTRPLAKAPLFEQPFVGMLLRGLGGLPIYRPQDDPGQTHRNEETFRGAIDALRRGDAIQIYPEGKSHSEPSLAPLKTGAARIALAAEQDSGWNLGLRIAPVGLTFERKSSFRGRAIAVVGVPFGIAHLREVYEADPVAAAQALTERIAQELERVTINVAEQRDAELIDTAERLYTREKGSAGWREREPLAERMPRLRAFARGLAWLRERDPARHARLARSVARYRRRLVLLGASEGDVPPRYSPGGTLRYVLTHGALLLLLAPAALIGSIIWYPTYAAPRLTLRLVKTEPDTIATYKLATAFALVPATVLVAGMVGAVAAGWRGALLAVVGSVVLGFAAVAWHDRWNRFRDDAVLFIRTSSRADQQERLAAERAWLTAEFDALQTQDQGVRPVRATPE